MTTIAETRHVARRRARPAAITWWVVCLVLAALFLFPLVMVVLTAFKTPQEAVASPPTYLPSQISFGNFINLWNAGSGLRVYLANSIGVFGWPYDETTTSYAGLATAAGSPAAVRAVGTACATNPLPIVVPCHRVIRSDGSPGRYVGGDAAKATLLTLEISQENR